MGQCNSTPKPKHLPHSDSDPALKNRDEAKHNSETGKGNSPDAASKQNTRGNEQNPINKNDDGAKEKCNSVRVASTNRNRKISIQGQTDHKKRISNQTTYDDILNHYIFTKPVDAGSFGVVRTATHIKTKGIYAVKTISKSQEEEVDMTEYLRNEIETMLMCDNENIIKCHNVFEDDYSIHFVLDYVEGGDLYTYIMNAPDHCLSELNCADLFTQMVKAVQYLHNDRNIAHRDIKPENFLLQQEHTTLKIILIDFGFSRICREGGYMYDRVGSLQYMAPEILSKDSKHDRSVDCWALGVVLFNMLTGKQPFSKKNGEAELIQNIKEVNISRDSSWRKLSHEVKDLINKLLEPNVNDRFIPGDILNHDWIVKNKMIASTCRVDFKPNAKQIKEIYDVLLLPTVNLKTLVSDILLQLNVQTVQKMKDYFAHKMQAILQEKGEKSERPDKSYSSRDQMVKDYNKSFFNEENIIDYFTFLNEILQIKDQRLPEKIEKDIVSILSQHEEKTKQQKVDCLFFLEKTITSITYTEKEHLKELIMNYDEHEEGFIRFEDFQIVLQKEGKEIPNNLLELIQHSNNEGTRRNLTRFSFDPTKIHYHNSDEFFELWLLISSLKSNIDDK